jgi:hypothetical protein
MTDQPTDRPGNPPPDAARSGEDRLESLICALIELKSNISIVEQQHPSLSNDLSSLCDIVIAHLNRSDGSALPGEQSQAGEGEMQCPPAGRTAKPLPAPKDIENLLSADESIPNRRANPINSLFDRAGDHLINGLDKMGDGVIYVFEKLLSLGSQKKPGPDEEACE